VSTLGWIGWSVGVAVLMLGVPVLRRSWRGEATRLERATPYITAHDPEWEGWVRSMPSAWLACVWVLLALALLTLAGDAGGAASSVLRPAGLGCAALALVCAVLSFAARFLGYPNWVIAPHLRDR
jgi:hypothetical protein